MVLGFLSLKLEILLNVHMIMHAMNQSWNQLRIFNFRIVLLIREYYHLS